MQFFPMLLLLCTFSLLFFSPISNILFFILIFHFLSIFLFSVFPSIPLLSLSTQDQVDAAVKLLLALKAEYKQATGQDYKPGAALTSAPAPKSAPVQTAPAAGLDIYERVSQQGELVRKLKAEKVSKVRPQSMALKPKFLIVLFLTVFSSSLASYSSIDTPRSINIFLVFSYISTFIFSFCLSLLFLSFSLLSYPSLHPPPLSLHPGPG